MVQNMYNKWLASFSLNNQWKSCLKVYNENFNDNYDSWCFYGNEDTIAYTKLKR